MNDFTANGILESTAASAYQYMQDYVLPHNVCTGTVSYQQLYIAIPSTATDWIACTPANQITLNTVAIQWGASLNDIRTALHVGSVDLEKQKKEEVERQAKRSAARARAKELLETLLAKEQREQLAKEGAFELAVNDNLYRIRPGRQVEKLDAEKKVECRFCVLPEDAWELPEEDVAISQKLMLESDEAAFLKTANRFAA